MRANKGGTGVNNGGKTERNEKGRGMIMHKKRGGTWEELETKRKHQNNREKIPCGHRLWKELKSEKKKKKRNLCFPRGFKRYIGS